VMIARILPQDSQSAFTLFLRHVFTERPESELLEPLRLGQSTLGGVDIRRGFILAAAPPSMQDAGKNKDAGRNPELIAA
jgi:hypothetical protein